MHQYTNNLFKNSSKTSCFFFFDKKLSFLEHIDEKLKKTTIGVNLIHKLNLLLPRLSLPTVNLLPDLTWTMKMLLMINQICVA